jgi:serine/threonine protein kinase
MKRVRTADPEDQFPLMKIQRYFENDNKHMCIVMPKYGPCLLDWLQKHGPFQPRHLAEIIYQAGIALDFFHSDLRLIHTDLKPENMLLESSMIAVDPISGKQVPTLPCKVRICDLGGCCDEWHSKSAIVSTQAGALVRVGGKQRCGKFFVELSVSYVCKPGHATTTSIQNFARQLFIAFRTVHNCRPLYAHLKLLLLFFFLKILSWV